MEISDGILREQDLFTLRWVDQINVKYEFLFEKDADEISLDHMSNEVLIFTM